MKLIANWKDVSLRAYSMWANYLGILCLILPELIYAVFDVDTNPRFWWLSGLILIVAGAAGRIIDQGIDRSNLRSGALVGVLAIAMAAAPVPAPEPAAAPGSDLYPYTDAEFEAVAVPHIAKWEGLRTTAYLDTIASPPVWTVCYGETKGVKEGDTYTERQCLEMLAVEVQEYRHGLHQAFTIETKRTRLTPHRDAAYTSLAYNAGIQAIRNSTATRRLNAGNIEGGCQAIGWYNKAGKRVIRGLVNRRADETAMCLRGLDT